MKLVLFLISFNLFAQIGAPPNGSPIRPMRTFFEDIELGGVAYSDLSRVVLEETVGFNPPVSACGFVGMGANPMLLPATANGVTLTTGCFPSPGPELYTPAVRAYGKAFYVKNTGVLSAIIKPNRTNQVNDLIIPPNYAAGFVSDGTTWNYRSILPNTTVDQTRTLIGSTENPGFGTAGQILSTNGAGSLTWTPGITVPNADISRVVNEEINSFNSPVFLRQLCDTANPGANPLVIPANVNGQRSDDGCYASPSYTPPVRAAGSAFYFWRTATLPNTIGIDRTNLTAPLAIPLNMVATFSSDGTTWNYEGMQSDTQFNAMRTWPTSTTRIGYGLTGEVLATNGAGILYWKADAAGDAVEGPAVTTLNAIPRWGDTTGNTAKNSGVLIADTTNAITGPQSVTVSGTPIPTLRADGNTDNQQAGTLFLSQGNDFGFKIAYDATNTNDGLLFIERRIGVETARMNIKNGGQVEIGTLPNTTNVGVARLEINGPNDNGNGPHMTFNNDGDIYPVRQFLNWNHNNVFDCFDCYHDGAAWRNSNASSAFRWNKTVDSLILAGVAAPTAGGTEAFSNYMWFDENGPAYFSRNAANTGTAPYTQVGGTIYLNGPRGQQASWRGLSSPVANNDAASEMWNQNGGWGFQRAWIVQTNSPPSVSFNGAITAQSYTNNSDRRLKTDIKDLPDEILNRFKDIRIVEFKWKDKPFVGRKITDELSDKEKETRVHYGVIAQEIEKIYPNVISEGEKTILGFHDGNETASEKKMMIKSLETTDLLAIAVKKIQQLEKRLNELEERCSK